MNAAQLLAHYGKVSEAPDAIARLRRLVLDLSVRGKLVPQDPNEESASVFLKRSASLAQSDRASKKAADGGKASPKQPARACPPGWALVPLGAVVVRHLGGGTPSKSNHAYWNGPVRWASVKDVGKTKYLDDTIDRITEEGLVNSASNLIPSGNLLVVTRMGLGKVSINRVPVAINQDLRALFLSPVVNQDYCYNFFLTHGFEGTGLTVKGIKVEELLNIEFPLPPLSEQHRIVAKVDELMALCDRLEAARTKREATRDRLTAATLARLNTPEPPASPNGDATNGSSFQSNARFALKVLPRFTTRPDQMKQLRQTILNLAVRGLLVRQESGDEPAAILLGRLKRARADLESAGLIRKLRVSQDGVPAAYLLPATWEWAPLSYIADVVDPNPSHRMPLYVSEGGWPFISSENFSENDSIDFRVGKQVDRRTVDEQIERFTIHEGAFGFSRIGSIGKTRPLPSERIYAISHAVCVVNPLATGEVSMRYLRLAMSVDLILAHAHGGTRSVGVPDLGMGVMRTMPIPLPPRLEQHRIVEKVNEMLSLCNQLEADLNRGQNARSRLLNAMLHEALAPAESALEAA